LVSSNFSLAVNTNPAFIKETFRKGPGAYKKPDGNWYIKRPDGREEIINANPNPVNKKAQRDPQRGTTYSGGDRTKDYITNAIGLLGTIGATILAGIGISRAGVSALRSGSWTDILNSIAPLLKILMNIIQEIFNTFNITGKNAPLSSQFYNNDGTLSDRGKLTLVNARETMISLGISDADAMALSKFQIEKDSTNVSFGGVCELEKFLSNVSIA